jgi:hypothetical protein
MTQSVVYHHLGELHVNMTCIPRARWRVSEWCVVEQ